MLLSLVCPRRKALYWLKKNPKSVPPIKLLCDMHVSRNSTWKTFSLVSLKFAEYSQSKLVCVLIALFFTKSTDDVQNTPSNMKIHISNKAATFVLRDVLFCFPGCFRGCKQIYWVFSTLKWFFYINVYINSFFKMPTVTIEGWLFLLCSKHHFLHTEKSSHLLTQKILLYTRSAYHNAFILFWQDRQNVKFLIADASYGSAWGISSQAHTNFFSNSRYNITTLKLFLLYVNIHASPQNTQAAVQISAGCFLKLNRCKLCNRNQWRH